MEGYPKWNGGVSRSPRGRSGRRPVGLSSAESTLGGVHRRGSSPLARMLSCVSLEEACGATNEGQMLDYRFRLTRGVLGSDGIELTEQDFREIQRAKRYQALGLRIEENFDLVLLNVRELERSLLEVSLLRSTSPGAVPSLLADARHISNLRMVNYLTTTRLYLDQASVSLKEVCGPSALETFSTSRRVEYAACFGYRVMEALRNYSQHRSLPINQITLVVAKDDAGRDRHQALISINVAEIGSDSEFKVSVLKELEQKMD